MPYIQVKVSLTPSQKHHITQSINNGESARLRMNTSKINRGDNTLLLTGKEFDRLQDGKTHSITISHSRLKRMHVGGFLPFLAAIPAILGALGGLGGLSAGIAATVKNAKEAQLIDAQKAALSKGSRIRKYI